MVAEGREPVPPERLAHKNNVDKNILDFDRYVPWYEREWFMLRRTAEHRESEVERLADMTYDVFIIARWHKIAESRALYDRH